MKEYYITNSRFKFMALLLLIIFLVFMLVIFLKADEVTKDPCGICAKKMGEQVTCYTGNLERVYYPNFTIINKVVGE